MKKQYKKWGDLTEREKIEALKLKINKPSIYIVFILMVFLVTALFSTINLALNIGNIYAIGNLYDKQGVSMYDLITSENYQNAMKSFNPIVQGLEIGTFLFLILCLYFAYENIKWNRKRKEFFNKIEVKKYVD